MAKNLIDRLRNLLADSNAAARKLWAEEIVARQVPLASLLSLLHGDHKTGQRFMWLIGDVCELEPRQVEPCLPLLFSWRDQMPFPGMPRSIAKWLWLTAVPTEIEDVAIEQLFRWLDSPSASIACKSYSAKGLMEMVMRGRAPIKRLQIVLRNQSRHTNRAYGARMEKLRQQLNSA